MSPHDNRRPGNHSRSGGDYGGSSNSLNVVEFPSKLNAGSPFQQLTARLVLARHRAGFLDPAVLVALLAAVGLQP
jgi:hypothetical protein